jgi:hypothetical protein
MHMYLEVVSASGWSSLSKIVMSSGLWYSIRTFCAQVARAPGGFPQLGILDARSSPSCRLARVLVQVDCLLSQVRA